MVPGVAELVEPGHVVHPEHVLDHRADLQHLLLLADPEEVDQVALEVAGDVSVGIDEVGEAALVQGGSDHLMGQWLHRPILGREKRETVAVRLPVP
jgi:hypothetical protein